MTRLGKISIAITVACTIAGASGLASAQGPGKPGQNPFAPGGTIVQVATAVNAKTGEFEYLLAAVGCLTDGAGNNPVVSALNGNRMLTLFAPTDDAFKALQKALKIDPPAPGATCGLGAEAVADVLTYHVSDGRRFANSVFNAINSKSLLMLNGDTITTNPDLTITDVAGQSIGVVPGLVNINAKNGVIHVIDTVMLPFTLTP